MNDTIELLDRVGQATARMRDRVVSLRRATVIVPIIWLVALIALGSLPGVVGLVVLVIIAMVWGVCYFLIGGATSGLDVIVSGMGTIQSAARSGAMEVDAIRSLPSGLTAKLSSERLSPLTLHTTYRSLRSTVGKAADLRSVSFAPYALGLGAVAVLVVIGVFGLVALLVGAVT